MIRLLGLAFLFYLGYLFWAGAARVLTRGRAPLPPEKTRHGEEMVQDPACGTYLPRRDAVTKKVRGRLYFFCCEKCRDAFRPEGGSG